MNNKKRTMLALMVCALPIISSVIISTTSLAQSYPPGIISYWKFEEGRGTVASDIIGSNIGTLHGPIWTSGQVGGALDFGNTWPYHLYVKVEDDVTLNPSHITVEAWVNPASFGYYRAFVTKRYSNPVYCWADPYVSYNLSMINNTAYPGMVVTIGGTWYRASSSVPLSLNAWAHLVGTYDGETIKIYLNGVLVGSNSTPSGPIDSSNDPLFFGYPDCGGAYPVSNNYLTGKIDEVAIYNRALTIEEIQQHYQNGLNGLGYEEPVIAVQIDIKPGSDPNSVNCKKAKGNIPVAILTTSDFDATMVDHTSVRFGKSGTEATEFHTDKKTGEPKRHEKDVDGDGDIDLVFHFRFGDTGFSCDDIPSGDKSVTLNSTLTGTASGTPIEGTDEITIKSKKKKPKGKHLSKIASDLLPDKFALDQNYPNPFNPETEIGFQLPEASYVVVRIFNTLGQEIRRLADTQYDAGYHRLRWDGKDKNGHSVSSGVYLYQMQAGDFVQVRKMSLLR